MKLCLAIILVFCACGGKRAAAVDAGPDFPPWSRARESTEVSIGIHRGFVPLRSIIHLHSPFSHDACDGQGYDEATGDIDQACLTDLREALCITRTDFAALTDHDDFMAHKDFVENYMLRGTDELIRNAAGDPIASRLHCESGHQVLWTIGGENSLMPIMLDRHPEGSISERQAVYNGNDEASVSAYHALGALAFIAHTESKGLDLLRSLDLDGLEIYNLHANLSPDIRKNFLGLDGPAGIAAALKYAGTEETGPEPDLAMLSFLEPSQIALQRWDTLLGEGRHLTGTAGTDAHQNALPLLFRDGERGDSYRRMIAWFSNIVLVKTRGDPAAINEALKLGRSYVVFDFMGAPSGFDVRATAAGKPTIELGGEVLATEGYTLQVTMPRIYNLDDRLEKPEMRISILRVEGSSTREVASGVSGTVTATLDRAGAYRVEVYIVPKHLAPYLGDLGPEPAHKELPWIYTNPIYVTHS